MECLLQYLDDLDDLVAAARMMREPLRRALSRLLATAMAAMAAAAGMWLALLHPPIALATATVLFVILLYHTVTAPVLKTYA